MNAKIRFDLGSKFSRYGQGRFDHTFGGDTQYSGITPSGSTIPVHLLFRIDLSDPNVPLAIDGELQYLPLFFAFSYDAAPLSYRIISDNEIEILGIDTTVSAATDPYPGFPRTFDLIPVEIDPISYHEQRDIAMVWYIYSHPIIHSSIPCDEIDRLKSQGYPIARLGRIQDLLQLPRGESCPNSSCDNHTLPHSLEVFATIPERPLPGIDLWESDGSTIQIVYEICRLCCSIRTYATYD